MKRALHILGGVLSCALLAAVVSPSPGVSASVDRKLRVRHLLEMTGWAERVLEEQARTWDRAEGEGRVPPGFGRKFRASADRERLLALGVDAWSLRLSDSTLDAALAFFSRPEGRELAGVDAGIETIMDFALRTWSRDQTMGVLNSLQVKVGTLPDWAGPEIADNERHAVERLRTIARCQALAREHACIDADRDGRGEYGTLRQLASGVRPRVLHEAFAAVDGDGVATVRGYRFRVFLPAAADGAEGSWRCYAWPDAPGVTGSRAFFVDERGTVFAALNGTARYGAEKAPAADAAVAGGDGEVWTPVE